MLEVAHMGLHVAQMTGTEEMRRLFEAVTLNGAKVMGLEGYGLAPGCFADMVVLQAGDPVEALRLKPARLFVIRRGDVIAETSPTASRLNLGGQALSVDFRHAAD
jgi:cytosine deaminase